MRMVILTCLAVTVLGGCGRGVDLCASLAKQEIIDRCGSSVFRSGEVFYAEAPAYDKETPAELSEVEGCVQLEQGWYRRGDCAFQVLDKQVGEAVRTEAGTVIQCMPGQPC